MAPFVAVGLNMYNAYRAGKSGGSGEDLRKAVEESRNFLALIIVGITIITIISILFN